MGFIDLILFCAVFYILYIALYKYSLKIYINGKFGYYFRIKDHDLLNKYVIEENLSGILLLRKFEDSSGNIVYGFSSDIEESDIMREPKQLLKNKIYKFSSDDRYAIYLRYLEHYSRIKIFNSNKTDSLEKVEERGE